MAREVRVVEDDVMVERLHEQINFNGRKKWMLFAFTLLLVVLGTIVTPVILTIIRSRRHHPPGRSFDSFPLTLHYSLMKVLAIIKIITVKLLSLKF